MSGSLPGNAAGARRQDAPGGGLGLFQRIKALRPAVKVVMCTGYGPEGEAQRILDAGANGFLPKSFELEELRRAAEAALAAR